MTTIIELPHPGRPRRAGAPRSFAGGRARRLDARTARDVAALPPAARDLRRQVLAWALHRGRPVNADALSAILGAKVERTHEALCFFDEATVTELLWLDIFHWAMVRYVEPPDLVAPSLAALFEFLEDINGFTADSDPLAQLFEPLIDAGGLPSRRARSRPSPA